MLGGIAAGALFVVSEKSWRPISAIDAFEKMEESEELDFFELPLGEIGNEYLGRLFSFRPDNLNKPLLIFLMDDATIFRGLKKFVCFAAFDNGDGLDCLDELPCGTDEHWIVPLP